MIQFVQNNFSVLFLGCSIVLLHSGCAQQWPSQSLIDIIKPVSEKCLQKLGIDPELIANARKGALPNDGNLKDYLLCVFDSFDWIDKEHHDFEYWKIVTMVPKEMKKEALHLGTHCTHFHGDDYGQATLDFITCLRKADPSKDAFLF